MLRRRLIIIFGSLVILLFGMAAAGVWLLHDVLRMLDHVNTSALAIADQTKRLSTKLTDVELELYRLQIGETRHLDRLIDDVESVRGLLTKIRQHYVMHSHETEPYCEETLRRYSAFENKLSSLATVQDAELMQKYMVDALSDLVVMRENVLRISQNAHEHADYEQRELTDRFRWLILGQVLGGLLVINVSILVLLRAAAMVLGPVDKLVKTSREFAREHFDHRAQIKGRGEFSELAHAYNDLAERIQTHEQRRMATLSQAALALSHELNNAMTTIEMQLEILGNRAGGERIQVCLRHIRECLQQMARTVEQLKSIRRIVLTDYLPGTKMLDLQRSTEDAPAEEEPLVASEGREEVR